MANISEEFILGILIAIQQNKMPMVSTNNEYRTIFNILDQEKLIDVSLDCNRIAKIVNSGTLLEKDSASRTRQWLNIELNPFSDYVGIKLGEKMNEYITKYQTSLNLTPTQTDALRISLDQIVRSDVEKLKHNVFVKIGGISNGRDDPENYQQGREFYYYKLLNRRVFEQNLPHIATLIYGDFCSLNKSKLLSNVKVDTPKSTQSRLDTYFNESIRPDKLIDYSILITENMSRSVSLLNYIDSSNKLDESTKNINSIQLLFQLVYTLEIFRQMKFVHNDLHIRNIYIEYLENKSDYFYVLGDKIVHLKTSLLVRIFDFDRSYQLENTPYFKDWSVDYHQYDTDYESKFDFFYVLRWLELEFTDPKLKYDFLAKQINQVFYGVLDTINRYPVGNKPVFDSGNIRSNRQIIEKAMTTDEWLSEFSTQGGEIGNIINDPRSNITIYDSLKDIPITKNSEIFFYSNANIASLKTAIEQNESWNQLSMLKQLIVCSPLVSQEKYNAELSEFIKEQVGITKKKIPYDLAQNIRLSNEMTPPLVRTKPTKPFAIPYALPPPLSIGQEKTPENILKTLYTLPPPPKMSPSTLTPSTLPPPLPIGQEKTPENIFKTPYTTPYPLSKSQDGGENYRYKYLKYKTKYCLMKKKY